MWLKDKIFRKIALSTSVFSQCHHLQRAVIICIVRQSVCLVIVLANHRVSLRQVSMENDGKDWPERLLKLSLNKLNWSRLIAFSSRWKRKALEAPSFQMSCCLSSCLTDDFERVQLKKNNSSFTHQLCSIGLDFFFLFLDRGFISHKAIVVGCQRCYSVRFGS